MAVHYVFDVDGTLTPSRSVMDFDFHNWFVDFCKQEYVYLVTGSDRVKTVEQVGIPVYFAAKRVYNCSGNEVWERDRIIRQNNIHMPIQLLAELKDKCSASKFPIKTGNHIETRMGLVNFSTVGRNASNEERKKYVEFDKVMQERNRIACELSTKFPEYQFQVAGETGIDIIEKGKDKSQIIKDFNAETDYLIFFGDTTYEGGNDYPLKKAIEDNNLGTTYQVNGWKDTWEILENESWLYRLGV